MSLKITLVGKGNVGKALSEGLQRAGHTIRFASRDPDQPVGEAVAWGEIIFLAVPWRAHQEIAPAIGKPLAGKTVIDVSNALTPSYELALGFTTSGAEELQKLLPEAKVIKAFNTVFAQTMSTGRVKGERLTVFVAGDDSSGKNQVLGLAREIGFDAVDAGPLKAARYLEPLGMLNISLGYGLKMGTVMGLKLVR